MAGKSRKQALKTIKSRKFSEDIVELAPYTRYVGCMFNECEFVGCGPVRMAKCAFKKCDERELSEIPGVWVDDCNFYY